MTAVNKSIYSHTYTHRDRQTYICTHAHTNNIHVPRAQDTHLLTFAAVHSFKVQGTLTRVPCPVTETHTTIEARLGTALLLTGAPRASQWGVGPSEGLGSQIQENLFTVHKKGSYTAPKACRSVRQ